MNENMIASEILTHDNFITYRRALHANISRRIFEEEYFDEEHHDHMKFCMMQSVKALYGVSTDLADKIVDEVIEDDLNSDRFTKEKEEC